MSDMYADYTSFGIDRPVAGVLRITFNRPEQLNALDAEAHRQLSEIWRVVDADPETRAVLLTSTGKHFSVGGDFAVVERMMQDFEFLSRVWREARDLVYNIINCSKPIVSAVQGTAVGAGLAAAVLADISIVAKDAMLIDGHVRLGVAAGDHAAFVWPMLCGLAKAKLHLLLNEPVQGEQAEQMGLVSMSVDASELQDRAIDVATRLAQGSPTAIRWTKHALNNWLRSASPSFDASLAYEMLGFAGPDVGEGLASHKQKRPPNFSTHSPV